jgi:hypothetical protein
VTSICSCRTPWFSQSDASFVQEIKPKPHNEAQVLRFSVNVSNLINQRTPTAYISRWIRSSSRASSRRMGSDLELMWLTGLRACLSVEVVDSEFNGSGRAFHSE